ncbi:MAG: FtsX-like permease family protein [bacterium]
MSVNTLRLLYRQMKHNRLITTINISGLAIAMAVVLLIGLLLRYELGFEKSLPNSEHLAILGIDARLGNDQVITIPNASAPMPVDLKNDVAGIENYCRIDGHVLNEIPITSGETRFIETGVIWADSSFFQITGLTLSQGDPNEALAAPNSVVITRDAARRFFGDADPIGKELRYRNTQKLNVSGVIESMPFPSMFQDVRYIISWNTRNIRDDQPWLNSVNWLTLVQIAKGTILKDLQPALDASTERHTGELLRQIGGEFHLTLTWLRDIHLHGNYQGAEFTYGRINFVIQFAAIALVVLLIASLNYINMTTAQSTRRGLFVGISKTLGASRTALVRQFLGESVITSLFATAIGAVVAVLLIPRFSNLVDANLRFNLLKEPQLLIVIVLAAVIVGLLAGFYPALILSGYQPAKVIKREMSRGRGGARLRSILVVLQYGIAVVLIIASLVVLRQMHYVRVKDLGFNRHQVLTVRLGNWDLMTGYRALYDEFRKLPFITASATADDKPLQSGDNSIYHIPGTPMDAQVFIASQSVDHDYIDAMGMHLIAGRNFDPERSTDSTEAVIVNEAAAKYLGYGKDPVGKQIDDYESVDPVKFSQLTIIGMVKDFHFESLHDQVRPMFLRIYEGYPPWLLFRLQPGTEQQAVAKLEQMWKEFAPEVPVQYSFLDEEYNSRYLTEQRMSDLFNLFTLVAIFVASLGLFALATFAAERRTKEIGIRKALGASSGEIVGLLVREFLLLVAVANLIAWPVAWYLMRNWLNGFAYRIDFSWWLFGATAGLSLLLAVATVSGQALRASSTNPVNALRYE